MALVVGLVVAVSGMTANTVASAKKNVASLGDVGLFVSSARGNDYPSEEVFPAAWKDGLAALPGVTSVRAGQFAFITYKRTRVLVQAVEAGTKAPAYRLASAKARAAVDGGTGTIVSSQFARRFHVARGERIELATPTGPHSAVIADVVDSFAWEQGVVVLPLAQVRSWFQRDGSGWFEVQVAAGRLEEARAAAAAFAAAHGRAAVVESGPEALAETLGAMGQITATFAAMQWVIAGAGLLAVINAIVISVNERRRELGMLRALGSTRGQLRRLVVLEAASIGVLGGVVGGVLGIGLHYAIVDAMGRLTGYAVDFQVRPIATILAAVVAVALAAVAGAPPGARTARLDTAKALAFE